MYTHKLVRSAFSITVLILISYNLEPHKHTMHFMKLNYSNISSYNVF